MAANARYVAVDRLLDIRPGKTFRDEAYLVVGDARGIRHVAEEGAVAVYGVGYGVASWVEDIVVACGDYRIAVADGAVLRCLAGHEAVTTRALLHGVVICGGASHTIPGRGTAVGHVKG